MKAIHTKQEPKFAPVTVAVTCESQAELDALRRMARAGLAKERTAADANCSTVGLYAPEMHRLRDAGYGTVEGIDAISTFFRTVIDAGGK